MRHDGPRTRSLWSADCVAQRAPQRNRPLYAEKRARFAALPASSEPAAVNLRAICRRTVWRSAACRAPPELTRAFSKFLKPESRTCASEFFVIFRAKLSPCDWACKGRAITDLALSSGTLAKRPNPWYFLRIFPSLTTEPSFSCGCYRKESGRLWVEGTEGCFRSDRTCGHCDSRAKERWR